jgi:multimeric flavodoxin WrbA
MILDKIEGLEITEFFLPKDMPNFCRGCFNCIFKGEGMCPDRQYIEPIKKAILEADLIVMTSPVYCLAESGQIKALLDHFGFMFMTHRPEESVFNKIGLSVVTAAGAGMKGAQKTLKTSMKWWGVKKQFQYLRAVAASSYNEIQPKNLKKMEEETSKLAIKIRKALEHKDHLKPNFTSRALFFIMKLMHKGHPEWNELDASYWKDQGFLDGKKPWIVRTEGVK